MQLVRSAACYPPANPKTRSLVRSQSASSQSSPPYASQRGSASRATTSVFKRDGSRRSGSASSAKHGRPFLLGAFAGLLALETWLTALEMAGTSARRAPSTGSRGGRPSSPSLSLSFCPSAPSSRWSSSCSSPHTPSTTATATPCRSFRSSRCMTSRGRLRKASTSATSSTSSRWVRSSVRRCAITRSMCGSATCTSPSRSSSLLP